MCAIIITLVTVTSCFVTKATPVHRKLPCVSKRNKLVQLVVQVQYHLNVIYCLGGGDAHIHILTLRTKAISKNQARASQTARTWFKNIVQGF